MKLHTSGIKLHKAGTIQDVVMRSYLVKEAELEAKKTEFMMLIALTNPQIQDDGRRSDWSKSLQKSWKQYLSRLFYQDLPQEDPEEELLKEYYDTVVSKLRPVLRKDRATGKLQVSGLEQMLK